MMVYLHGWKMRIILNSQMIFQQIQMKKFYQRFSNLYSFISRWTIRFSCRYRNQIAATTVDLNGNLDVSGTLKVGSGATVSTILDEDDFATNSDTALATQQSVKAYVDAQVATVPTGDITAVTAGTGLSGGGTTGAVTLDIDATVATLTGSQVLASKTLTSPVLNYWCQWYSSIR